MDSTRGPVVVGMDAVADEPARIAAMLDLAAHEAIRRGVDLRLVYGRDALPTWALAAQILARVVDQLEAAHPGLAVTTAIYPGTASDALALASATAGHVVATPHAPAYA